MLSTAKSKVALTPEQKKLKVAQAREFHAELLKNNNARDVDFNLKTSFYNKGVLVVGLYPSELIKENGFFLELIDGKLDPVDPQRTVYKIGPVENYEDVYEILQIGTFAVPLEELEVVKAKTAPQKFKVDMSTLSEVKDDNITNMTITDFAAIMWGKPVSGKEWLNNLINQNI